MRRIVCLGTLLFLCSDSFSQNTINVTKLVDAGEQHPSMSLSILPLDVNTKFASSNISLNIRCYGFLEVKPDKLGLYYNFSQEMYNFNSDVNILKQDDEYELSSDLDLSVYWLFKKLNQKKTSIIVVKRNYWENSYTYFTETVNWSAVKGVKLGYTSIYANMYLEGNNETWLFPYIPTKTYDLNIKSQGFSIGYFKRTYSHIVVEELKNKKKHSGIGGGIFYADALILPFQTSTDRRTGTNVSDSVNALGKISPLGFRVGYKTFDGTINKPLQRGGLSLEAGYIPFHSIYINIGVGFTIINKHWGKNKINTL